MRQASVARPGGLMARWSALPRLVRFFLVGGLNTAFGYGAYASLLYVGFHYAWAALLGTIAGIAFNYFTTGLLVFERKAVPASPLRFVAVYAAMYLVNVACLAVLDRLGLDPYVSGLLLIVPMALVSYVAMRRFVFGG